MSRFVEDMVEHVMRPLFSAADVDQFRERLPEALGVGVNLRTRFMLDLVEMDTHAVVRDMLTSPPREVHENLAEFARNIVPSDPFMLIRAFQLSAVDVRVHRDGVWVDVGVP